MLTNISSRNKCIQLRSVHHNIVHFSIIFYNKNIVRINYTKRPINCCNCIYIYIHTQYFYWSNTFIIISYLNLIALKDRIFGIPYNLDAFILALILSIYIKNCEYNEKKFKGYF